MSLIGTWCFHCTKIVSVYTAIWFQLDHRLIQSLWLLLALKAGITTVGDPRIEDGGVHLIQTAKIRLEKKTTDINWLKVAFENYALEVWKCLLAFHFMVFGMSWSLTGVVPVFQISFQLQLPAEDGSCYTALTSEVFGSTKPPSHAMAHKSHSKVSWWTDGWF